MFRLFWGDDYEWWSHHHNTTHKHNPLSSLLYIKFLPKTGILYRRSNHENLCFQLPNLVELSWALTEFILWSHGRLDVTSTPVAPPPGTTQLWSALDAKTTSEASRKKEAPVPSMPLAPYTVTGLPGGESAREPYLLVQISVDCQILSPDSLRFLVSPFQRHDHVFPRVPASAGKAEATDWQEHVVIAFMNDIAQSDAGLFTG